MLKRGESKLLSWNLVLILLMLFLFIGLDFFVYRNLGSSAVLEDRYAKKISLLIDEARPETVIYVDMTDGAKIARNAGMFPEVYIKDNEVFVKLTIDGGNRARFYSTYKVNFEYLKSEEKLKIEIKNHE